MILSKDINIILTQEEKEKGFQKLFDSNANIFHYPMIKTEKILNIEEFDISKYHFYIFTSKNGVKYFFNQNFIKKQNFKKIKSICIGNKTEKILKNYNVDSSYTSKRNYAEKMCEELKRSKIINSKKVLLINGNLSKNNLFNCLKKFSNIKKIIFYKTSLVNKKENNMNELISNKETYTVFTSSSGFDAFSRMYNPKKTKIISIGNSTSNFIIEKGYYPLLTSQMQSYEGITESIVSFFKKKII